MERPVLTATLVTLLFGTPLSSTPLFSTSLFSTSLFSTSATPGSDGGVPELGRVGFGRDVDAALRVAKSTGKPVFLLFQEIPGCSTCRSFGAGPLSQPLLVEAIETLFVPVVVHNNRGGADAAVLARFGEPAWNNPVARFLGADGRDLVPREEGAWSSAALATRMLAALRAAGQTVPGWLELAQAELDPAHCERVVFAMHCFWEGQAALGGLPGVVDASPGFLDGAEVVEVSFVPRALPFADLVRRADALDCAVRVASANAQRVEEARTLVGERARRLDGLVQPAKVSDDLRHLKQQRRLDLAPLTRSQAVHVNAALALGRDVDAALLSPRQLELVRSIERTLAKHAAAFDGLERPSEVAALAAYSDGLAARLGDG